MKLFQPKLKEPKVKIPKLKLQQKLELVLQDLKQKNLIDENQYNKLNIKTKKPITQEQLLEKLTEMGVTNTVEPLDQSVKAIVPDLGSLNAADLVALSNALRLDRKGLNDMTPIPQKAFPIPGNILFMAMIGAAIFLVIVGSSWGSISAGLHLGGGGPPGQSGIGGIFGKLLGHFILGVRMMI